MKKRAIWLILAVALWMSVPVQAAEEKYRLTVNVAQNIVTVYDATDTAVRTFYCSVGKGTPLGTFHTSDRYTWRALFGNVYGQYATRITGHILFHSVPYTRMDKSTLETAEYNRLGETASMGCIRLTVADAKWIYDHCASGTTVTIFSGQAAEPLTPTATQVLDAADARSGWDPTDPDPANPWQSEPQPVQPQPEQQQTLTMQSRAASCQMAVYDIADAYWFSAADAQVVFGHLGVALVLPKQMAEGSETVSVRYRRQLYQPAVQVKDGKAYYRLDDLAGMTGAAARRTADGATVERNGLLVRCESL